MDNFDLKKYLVENKVTTNSRLLNEAASDSVDKALDNATVKAAGEKLAADPAKLQQALKQAKEMGVDVQALKQAAQAFAAGKSVDAIVGDEVDTLKSTLHEEESATSFGAKAGGVIGGVVGLFAGAGTAIVIPALLVGALIFGLAGAGIGRGVDKGTLENKVTTNSKTLTEVTKDEMNIMAKAIMDYYNHIDGIQNTNVKELRKDLEVILNDRDNRDNAELVAAFKNVLNQPAPQFNRITSKLWFLADSMYDDYIANL
jgi:outer membrane lipoprotein SlyB